MGIYQRGKKWYADLYYRGRRIRKAVGNKKDAERALIAIKADILRGEYRFKKTSKIRFDIFSKEYLEFSKKTKRSWKRDRTSLKALSRFFGMMRLSDINAGHIEKYKTLRIPEVSAASLNRELSCFSALFTLAKKSKLVEANPVREVKKLQERKLDMRILNDEEARRLIEKSKGHLRPIVIIALNTGMRAGEIFNLRWNDIDFEHNFIFIKRTKSGITRKIPMNGMLAAALKGIKRKSEFVFVNSSTEKPITRVDKSFKTACDNAKIKDLRFHDLRHTSASWMVMAGVDLVTVAQILGHSDIKMTMRYAHPTPENRRKAVNVLAKIFGQEEKEKRENAVIDFETKTSFN